MIISLDIGEFAVALRSLFAPPSYPAPQAGKAHTPGATSGRASLTCSIARENHAGGQIRTRCCDWACPDLAWHDRRRALPPVNASWLDGSTAVHPPRMSGPGYWDGERDLATWLALRSGRRCAGATFLRRILEMRGTRASSRRASQQRTRVVAMRDDRISGMYRGCAAAARVASPSYARLCTCRRALPCQHSCLLAACPATLPLPSAQVLKD